MIFQIFFILLFQIFLRKIKYFYFKPNIFNFRRLVQYSATIATLAVLFNIPKFFEAEVVTMEAGEGEGGGWVEFTASELRTHPLYNVLYHCWARLIVLGVLPIATVSCDWWRPQC